MLIHFYLWKRKTSIQQQKWPRNGWSQSVHYKEVPLYLNLGSLTVLSMSCIPLSVPRKSPLSHQAFRYIYTLCTVLFVAEGVFAFSVQQYPYFWTGWECSVVVQIHKAIYCMMHVNEWLHNGNAVLFIAASWSN